MKLRVLKNYKSFLSFIVFLFAIDSPDSFSASTRAWIFSKGASEAISQPDPRMKPPFSPGLTGSSITHFSIHGTSSLSSILLLETANHMKRMTTAPHKNSKIALRRNKYRKKLLLQQFKTTKKYLTTLTINQFMV